MKQNAKICAIGQYVMKLEVFILGGQRIDQKRKKGWWIGRRERIEKRSRDRIEIKETKGKFEEEETNIDTCLCLLFKVLHFS